MNKFVLVTGGAGYIGSHTVVALQQKGFTPVIADDFRNANDVVFQGLTQILGAAPILHRIDVCDHSALDLLFEQYQFEGVIHFAAYKAVGESVEKPLAYYQNNLVGLINVLAMLEKHKVHNFVFSSSCTVYGEPKGEKEVSEATPKQAPESPYGFTKWMGEQIIADFHQSAPAIKLMNLRYFNPVGAHPSALIGEYPIGKPNNLLPFVTQTAIGKHAHLTVFGNDYPTRDGSCIRDYIHVMDLAEAHVAALEFLSKQNAGLLEAVNIGTGKGTSVLEIVAAFEKVTGHPLPHLIGPRRAGDVIEIFANAKKGQELLGWKARLSIEDAIKDAWAWENYLAASANQ
ncbi:MAG: UDP-glucose 4-epimerase GalE [Flavobacteriales bacterium]